MNEPSYAELASTVRTVAEDLRKIKGAILGDDLNDKPGLVAQHRETRRRVRMLEVYAGAVGMIAAAMLIWMLTEGRAGGASAETGRATEHARP